MIKEEYLIWVILVEVIKEEYLIWVILVILMKEESPPSREAVEIFVELIYGGQIQCNGV